MARINDIVISEMAFNAMVRKMHNRIVGCQNLFEIQQCSVENIIIDDFEESRIERNKKLKMWEEEWEWEKIEFKKKRQKEREEDKQKKLQDKYILKLKENSHRNEVFYHEMNTTLNKWQKIIIIPNVVGNARWYNGYGLDKSYFNLSFFKQNIIVDEKPCSTIPASTKRFFGSSVDYNYTILKHKILDKMIEIAKDNNYTSIEYIRFVFTKPKPTNSNSVNVFVYLSHICLFEIDLPEF